MPRPTQRPRLAARDRKRNRPLRAHRKTL